MEGQKLFYWCGKSFCPSNYFLPIFNMKSTQKVLSISLSFYFCWFIICNIYPFYVFNILFFIQIYLSTANFTWIIKINFHNLFFIFPSCHSASHIFHIFYSHVLHSFSCKCALTSKTTKNYIFFVRIFLKHFIF